MHGRNAALIARHFPAYRSPWAAYAETVGALVREDSVWLDLGCGRRLFKDGRANEELPRRARLTVGVDRDLRLRGHASVSDLVVADATALPFRPATFSIVTASMLVEHLDDPESAFREVARVLRPGGSFVVFTPNVFHYGSIVARVTPQRFHRFYRRVLHALNRREWRGFEAELFPTRYRANSAAALRRAAERGGLRPRQIRFLSLAHSFGFVRPLYTLSLMLEARIDRWGWDALKADILAVFDKPRAAEAG